MLVRTLGPEDVAFATRLASIEGWSLSAQDYQCLLQMAPQGCFVAEEDDEPAGLVITALYGKLGWIGGLIVKRRYRQRGHGRALLDRAVACLLDAGARTVGLDATLQAAPFYERAGFKPAYELLHLRRAAMPAPAPIPDSLVPMDAKDLHTVAMFDWTCFGGPREDALRSLLQRSPVALLAQDQSGVAGYLMARRKGPEWVIGPWVCVRSAEPLLTAALRAIGQEPISLGVPKVNEHALHALRGLGFKVYYREMRMYQGDREGIGHPRRIYAIASAEMG